MEKTYKLTQYSHGAGCGCKISPKVLNTILQKNNQDIAFPGLLVGNEERDDAAVMDLGDGSAIISTTDFFMPIVDDPFDFGRIASVNAISDVYAMGGSPLLAIAILGWPINQIPPEIANEVMNGARKACGDAGIPLAGGHSIDSPEPIFGLAVTGKVNIKNLKKNSGAKAGSLLYLTKPLGVGILSTAGKKGLLKNEHRDLARDSMIKLNKIGEQLASLDYVEAMTDVTGFGLLGHLAEMCEASGVSATIEFEKIPWLDQPALENYIHLGCIPGGTNRNWDSYGHKIDRITAFQKAILCDPQTSGGLLVAVSKGNEKVFEAFCNEYGLKLNPIARLHSPSKNLISLI